MVETPKLFYSSVELCNIKKDFSPTDMLLSLDYLNIQGLNNFKFLYRNLDQTAWKYCNKGFFNFKKYIPNFIGEFFK